MGLVLVMLWRALLAGGLLSPASVLYSWFPWSAERPDISGFDNPVLSDVPLAFYPWAVFTRDAFHHGVFPVWNPYVLSGTPFFSNGQAALLSPFNVPLWVLPLRMGLAVTAALKLWLGGFGTYLLVRELRQGAWPALLAGVTFALCAFNVVWLTHGVQVSVAVLLPWALLLTERIVRRGRAVDSILLAVVVAVAMLAGHPGTQLHLLAGAALYALLRAGLRRHEPPSLRLRRVGLAAAGALLGVALAAVVLVPIALATPGSVGAVAREGGGFTLPFSALRTALFPDWWGRPTGIATGGPLNYNERTFYAGTVALVLSAVALTTRGGWRRKAPFAVLMAFGLAVPLGAPGFRWLVAHLPLFDTVYNARMLLWFDLGVAVLGGFGLQTLLDARAAKRRGFVVVAAAILVGVVAVATLGPTVPQLRDTVHHFITGRDFADPDVIALSSVAWWSLLAAAVGVALLLLRLVPAPVVAAGLVVLAGVDMFHFAHGYQPIGPPSKVIPPQTPAVSFVARHASEGRVVGLGFITFANDFPMIYGIRDARGHDPPQPSLRYVRLWRLANPFQGDGSTLTLPDRLDAQGTRVMSVLGVRWIVASPKAPRPAGPGISVAYRGPDGVVYENRRAVPRARVARSVRLVSGEAGTLAALAGPSTAPTVEGGQRGAGAVPTVSGGGTVRVTRDDNSHVTLRASLPRRGLVVLDDALVKGWSVRVDGRPATALRVDSVMRGVVVPGGKHVIDWRYRVPGLRVGAAISVVALLVLLTWIAILLAHRARSARRPAMSYDPRPGRTPGEA